MQRLLPVLASFVFGVLPCAAAIEAASLNAAPQNIVATPSAPVANGPSVPIRIISRLEFCGRLQAVFANFGVATGLNQAQSALLASNAASQLIDEFRGGRASDYLNAAALANMAIPLAPKSEAGYLPLAGFIGPALGLGPQINIALTAGELRFIPFAQRGVDLVVVAQNAAALSPERVRKVAALATQNNIHIHVLWVGIDAEASAMEEARALAWLAAVTGGAFANLAGNGNACINSL